MQISEKIWDEYIQKLNAIDTEAAERMRRFLAERDWWSSEQAQQETIDFAFLLAQEYGLAAGALTAEMYDAIIDLSYRRYPQDMTKKRPPDAEIAPTATYTETATAVAGAAKDQNPEVVASAVSRLAKQVSVDTMAQNAIRDGAQWAWIPRGDTCAFCIMLASNGWQNAGKSALKNGHAQHVHANCDCTYAVRFTDKMDVAGYDPQAYLDFYNSGSGTPEDKLNNMRRIMYEQNKEKINEQKRSAYAKRQERNAPQAEEELIE